MSKMKMSDVSCDVTFVDYVANAVKSHDRLIEENLVLTRERDFLAETIDQLSEHVGEAELQASSISIKYDSLVEEVERLRGERDELVKFAEEHKRWIPLAQYPFAIMEIDKLLAKIKGEDNE